MPLISRALVILATSLLASHHTAHTLPQQDGSPVTPSTAPPTSTTAPTTIPEDHNTTDMSRVVEITPLPDGEAPANTTVLPTTPEPTTVITPTLQDHINNNTITTTPPPTTTTTPPTTITPNTTTITTTTHPADITTTTTPTVTTTVNTTTPDNTTETLIPASSTAAPPSPVPTDSSPSSTITTASPGPHPGASIAISLFILVTVILVIGASVWWVRRRWQLERLRHQLMPVYNFDPTDDVDDWENQLLEEERSLRPEADKVQLYSGNATFEASQKTPSGATQKE